jgi:hypothetical protein
MSPVLDRRTAPDPASGAVSFRPSQVTNTTHASGTTPSTPAPPLRERDVWRAVAASVLATLRSWLR